MAIAGGNIFDPRSLSPALWLSDTGSDPAVWEDLSGNARHATQATAANRPAIVENVQNGRQVRRFDGNDSLVSSNVQINYNGASVFVVWRRRSGAQTGFMGILNHNAPVFSNRLLNVWSGNNTSVRFESGPPTVTTTRTIVEGQFSLFSGVISSSQHLHLLNSATPITGTGSTFTSDASNLTIGSYVGNLDGDIAEILIFPTALSTSDRKAVENYLAKKWGIGFNPLSLSPALWLSDTGSNPAQWDDISGNNRHATQATVASQPAIIQNGLGGRQVRRFDGVDDFLSCGDVINARTGSISIYMVAKFANINTSLQTIIAKGRNAAGVGGRWLFWRSGGNLQGAASFANAATIEVVSVADSNTSWRLLNADFLRSNGTAISHVIRRNEVSTIGASHTGSLTDFMLTNHLLIGAYNDGGSGGGVLAGSHLNGDIAEILVFSSVLSDTDRREVERYLTQKWNIIT